MSHATASLSFSNLIFIIICNLIIINTIFSYFSNNPIITLLYLVINYILVAFLFLYNGFVFLSLMFMLIYIGAVSILLLFTLMLLDFKILYYKNFDYKFLYLFITIVFFTQILYMSIACVNVKFFKKDDNIYINYFNFIFDENEALNLGSELFINNYKIFIILGLFLLCMLIASVSIVVSKKTSNKQNLYVQLKQYNSNLINV